MAQLTGSTGRLSSGCAAVMSVWQLTQAFVLWTEAASRVLSTNNEMTRPAGLVTVRVLSAWQTRQSSSDITGAAMAPAARTSQSPVNAIFSVCWPLPILTNIRRPEPNHSTRLGICCAYFDEDGHEVFVRLNASGAWSWRK